MTSNPYIPPAPPTAVSGSTEPVTLAEIASALYTTSHWVRVFAGTLAAISLLMVVGGLSLVMLSYSALGRLSTMYFRVGLVLIAVGVLEIFPILKLAGFVRYSKSLHDDRECRFVAEALQEQRFFWQYTAIITLILIIVAVALFIGQ